MLIAQITDVHLGFEPGNPDEPNRKRLDDVLRRLCDGPNRPDLLLATGDLTDRGDRESYERLAEAFAACPFPVWPSIGNHDVRANFMATFPNVPTADGFVQYELEAGPLRLIILDTLEEGRHGGAFCDVRAAWLKARLAEQTGRPTIIVMHHPPMEAGIAWMNSHCDEPWVRRVTQAIAGRAQVQVVLSGHLHRNLVSPWNGTTVAVCASTAPQLALDLRPIDPEAPDGRDMIVAGAPAFALHWWNGRELVSHFETAGGYLPLARYDAALQDMVRGLLGEPPA